MSSRSVLSNRVSSQQVVRSLFQLPEDEDVLDDFSCSLKKKVAIHGRLFCTDNYLCFYANIFGFRTKRVIPFNEVIAIRRIKAKLSNLIDIECQQKKSYQFSSFVRSNDAFQFIYNLWRNSGYCDEDGEMEDLSDDETVYQEEEKGPEITMLPTEEQEGNAFESLRVVLPVTVQRFFELYLADNAVYGYDRYCKFKGDTELEMTQWVESPEFNGFTRELRYRTKIPKPPIGPDNSRIIRTHIYTMKEERICYKVSSKALDIPYGTYFTVEDEWNIVAQEGDTEKCLLTCMTRVNFLKSTIFRGTIEGRSKIDCRKELTGWLEQAQKYLGGGEKKTQRDSVLERQVHQVAKYEEVNFKEYVQKVTKLEVFVPKETGKIRPSLVYANLILTFLLLIWLWCLSSRVNEELYCPVNLS